MLNIYSVTQKQKLCFIKQNLSLKAYICCINVFIKVSTKNNKKYYSSTRLTRLQYKNQKTYWYFLFLDEELGVCGCETTCSMMRNGEACNLTVTSSTEDCCQCKSGKVRDEESGECVDVSQCGCAPMGLFWKCCQNLIIMSFKKLSS